MKKENKNKTLTLFFTGEINSANAPAVEQEAMKAIKGESYDRLVLDFAKVSYISSAGLRILLKLKQHNASMEIVETSLSVYDVLSMTGFTKLIPVSKALREVSVEGCEVVGVGYTATVYRIDKDTIVKVYRDQFDITSIQRELDMAKQAFVLGIPTAISFDVVKVGDHLGVAFEMLNSRSLRDEFRDHPEQFDSLIARYANLLKTINSTVGVMDKLPNANEVFINKVESLQDALEPKYYEKLLALAKALEPRDTFVHGDCHVKNILVQEEEFFLIDMDTLSKGNPILELAAIYAPYIAFEEDDPGNSQRFFGLPGTTMHRIYDATIDAYLGHHDPVALEKIALVAYTHMMWWNRTFEPSNEVRFAGCRSRLLPLIEKCKDLDIAC